MTLKQIINTWAKRLWQKLRGKKEEPKYDLYQIPNGPGFFVPKGTTPPQFGDNISIELPKKPIRPANPPSPPKEKVKADTDGDKADSMIYGVEAMRYLDLDEDDLKLTKEEIKEVDTKIDRWHGYNKSANETLKDMAEKFKDIQKNPKYHEDISPLLSGAAVSDKEVIDGITKAIREVTKEPTKKSNSKKRRRRSNSKKKSGEKK